MRCHDAEPSPFPWPALSLHDPSMLHVEWSRTGNPTQWVSCWDRKSQGGALKPRDRYTEGISLAARVGQADGAGSGELPSKP